MINKLIHFAVHQRIAVVLITLMIASLGWYTFQTLPIDAVPDVTNNQVQINTQVEGLSTEEAERKVTFPIETAVRGVPGVELVRSFTRFNLSQITVIFNDDVDIYRARQMVSERLQEVSSSLPERMFPRLGPITSGLGEIYHYAIEAETVLKGEERVRQLREIRTLQDWQVRPRLRTVKGVADVNTLGGYEKQFHIQPYPGRLSKHGLQFEDLKTALERTNKSVGAGFVKQTGEQFLVQSSGLLKSKVDIETVPVKLLQTFRPLEIQDLAQVIETTDLRTGAALINDQETVIGTVMMLLGENSRTVASNVDSRLDEIAKELPKGYKIIKLYNRSELVDFTLHTVQHNLMTGAFLVIIVLFLLVGNLRAAFITAITIPVTLLATFILMKRFGISGNLMSLGALDFGIIVDGTVILLDHCVRVIQDRKKALGRALNPSELKKAIYDASVEIRTAAGFGELIIVIVFLPIFSFDGVEGKMFRPMAATFIIAILCALVFSFTFAPALASLCLKGNTADQEPWIMRQIERIYAPVLSKFLKFRMATLMFSIGSVVVGALLFLKLGGEFIPQLDEGSILIECVRPVRSGLDASIALQAKSSAIVSSFGEVDHVFSKIGTAEIANDPLGVNQGDMYVVLKQHHDWPLIEGKRRTKEELIAAIFARLKEEVPGQSILPNQPIQNRFNDLLEGSRGDISVKVYGDDLETLEKLTLQLKNLLRNLRGTGEVGMELRGKLPLLRITPMEGILRKLGVSDAEVLETVSIALGGMEVGYVYDGTKRFPIKVRLDEKDRSNLELIRSLPVGFSLEATLPLQDLASIRFEDVYGEVRREEGNRRAAVMVSLQGRDVESYVKEAQQIVADKLELPAGYYLEWGGTFKNLRKAQERLLIVIPLALVLVCFMIFIAFRSIPQTILIFSCVPLALVGGVLGLILNGLHFSVSAGIGFIALLGIAVLNGVVLINYFNELHHEGLRGDELIKRGTLLRIRPILMTALVDIFGFLPMMLSSGVGSEVQKPLASVVIGGVLSSTLLSLIMLPIVYSLFQKKMSPKKPPGAGGH